MCRNDRTSVFASDIAGLKTPDKRADVEAGDPLILLNMEQPLTSLNLPMQPEMDRLQAKEAERRIAQIEEHKVNGVPVRKFFQTFARSKKLVSLM